MSPVLTPSEREKKDAAARQRACFDEEIPHIRAGWWQGPQEMAVHLVGLCADLHGTACTCCPTRMTTTSIEQPRRTA